MTKKSEELTERQKIQNLLLKNGYLQSYWNGNNETMSPTELGLKNYTKFCFSTGRASMWGHNRDLHDLTGNEIVDFAVQKGWCIRRYDIDKDTNVISPTKFGNDLWAEFEFWIDKKAQKKMARQQKMDSVMARLGKIMTVEMPKFMANMSKMMASMSPPEDKKNKPKNRKSNKWNDDDWEWTTTTRKRRRKTPTKKKSQKDSDNFVNPFEQPSDRNFWNKGE